MQKIAEEYKDESEKEGLRRYEERQRELRLKL